MHRLRNVTAVVTACCLRLLACRQRTSGRRTARRRARGGRFERRCPGRSQYIGRTNPLCTRSSHADATGRRPRAPRLFRASHRGPRRNGQIARRAIRHRGLGDAHRSWRCARENRLHELDPIQRAKNDEANAREHRAGQLWQQGKKQEAVAALAEAQQLAAQVWGEDNYAVANLIDQQARWHMAMGDSAAAELLFRQALTIREKVFSTLHPDTVTSTAALGLILQADGRTSEAEPLLRQSVERLARCGATSICNTPYI